MVYHSMIISCPSCKKKKKHLAPCLHLTLTHQQPYDRDIDVTFQVIIAFRAARVLARLIPDWLWKHLWFEKKNISQRHASVTGTHHPAAYITDLMATCFQPWQFFLFWLLSLSLWMYLPSPALTPPTGDSRAIKSLVPGLLLSKGCGYRQVCVGVV